MAFVLHFFMETVRSGPMDHEKLFIVMVGLPARGKSTIASKLRDNLMRDGIRTRIFNNGDLRRRLFLEDTSHSGFYDPKNTEGVALREKIALINIQHANDYIAGNGRVAILDATNVSRKRREKIISLVKDPPLLFIECINNHEEILEASILRKIKLPEFNHLKRKEAIQTFKERIQYYESIYIPLRDEKNYVKLDSFNNLILGEDIQDDLPYYERIRDFLVTDTVKNLFLVRHGETTFNLENRIGGDSPLTENGKAQARALAAYFKNKQIPFIFTSEKKRCLQTAEPIKRLQQTCTIVPLSEFNEIDAGICERMSYEEIREKMPHVHAARKIDKYNYIYPNGEGYVSMRDRVETGIRKALYLSTDSETIMIIGHRAVNRMILSHFLYRRKEDVPYVYIPQDKFYHIVSAQDKKLFQLKKY